MCFVLMNNPDIFGNNVHFSVWGKGIIECSQVHLFYIFIYTFLTDSVTLQSIHFRENGADSSNHDCLLHLFLSLPVIPSLILAPPSHNRVNTCYHAFKNYYSPNEYSIVLYCGYGVGSFCICLHWDICLYTNLCILHTRSLKILICNYWLSF